MGEGNKKLLGCCLIFSYLCYTREYHRINICRYNLNWILQTGLKTESQKHALKASLLGFKLISVMFGWCFKQPSVNSGKHRWLPVSNCYTVGIAPRHACVHTNTHKDEWLLGSEESKLFAPLEKVFSMSVHPVLLECVAHCVFNPPPFREACGWFWKGMTGSKIGVPCIR